MAKQAALAEAERQYLSRRRQAGATLAMIAVELDCSRETIPKWWWRQQRRG